MDEMTEYLLTIFPDDIWHSFFTPEGLTRFTPKRGGEGFMPMLEIMYLDADDTRCVATLLLAAPGWGNQERRYQIMADIGESCAAKDWRVFALVLAVEAWLAHVPITTPRHQLRPAKTYANKREVLHVAGKTMDGRMSMATAPLHRDPADKILGLGAWDVVHSGDGMPIETGVLDKLWSAYGAAMLHKHVRPDLN